MYKAKITNAEKVRHQASNSDFLDVSFDIVKVVKDGDEEKEVTQISKRIGMNVSATRKDVIKMVNSHVAEHEREVENAQLDAERQKANANVKDIQENLVGSTIEPGDEVEAGEDESEGESQAEEN